MLELERLEAGEIPVRLAHDLATGMLPVDKILLKYAITAAQLKNILKNPQFKIIFREAKGRWHSDTNTEERIRSKSSMLIEDSLLEIFGLIHKADSTDGTKIESFKQLASVANLTAKTGPAAPGGHQRTTITINIPPLNSLPAKQLSISGDVIEQIAENV